MHLGNDLRTVFRGFRETPAPAVLIVLTLGLAIGANSATFSLIDRVALRPLPVEKPYEIVIVNAEQLPYPCPCAGGSSGKLKGMSYPLFQSLRAGLSRSFSAMGAFRMIFGLTMAAEPSAIEIYGESVTADFFKVLGLHAVVGRTLVPSDEGQRDGPAIAVLNHGFWMRQFGGDPSILNRTIRLNNVPFTVVGVLAPGYSGMVPGYRPDVFVPVAMGDSLMPAIFRNPVYAWDSPTMSSHNVIARLAAGVTREAAERELRAYYRRLWDEVVRTRKATLTAKDMDVYRRSPPEVVAAGTVGSTQSATQRKLEVALRLLFAMTVFVLLVAAGNVANLLAASGARRGHEMAVSLALGARRWDLLRPRLVEALALAIVSGIAALLLAEWTGNLLPSLLGLGEDLAGIDTRPDARVVVFTAAMSLLIGLLIWLASALLVTRRAALPSLVAGRADATGRRPGAMLRRGLVVVQVALSLALVCAAVLFGRSLANVLSVDPGFDADHVVGFTVNPRAVGYDGDRLESYVQALVNRVRALPGVSRVAVSSVMPLSGGGCCTEVMGPRQQAGHAGTQYAAIVEVSPDYFATIGLGLVTGRAFDDHDVRTAPRVVIANEAAVRLLVDSPEVLGQKVGGPGAPASQRIVGVVRDGRSGLKTPAEPTLYLPRAQTSGAGAISVLMRVPRAEMVSATAVTDIVRRLDRGVALTAFGSLGTLARDALLRDRMLAGLSQVFAALAGLLAAMGLAGLTSVNVTRRTREIGVRLALGASRGSVQRLMLREVAVLIAGGTAAGLVLFLSANRVLRSMLFEISPDDPVTIALAIAALAAIGVLAGLLPARRAAHVDPAVTLRCE
ncbi:MAG: ADOP family duplicated permease [Bacteroidales bacterium]